MKKRIDITVAAQAGHGKTTIAAQIVNLLRCTGFNKVELIDADLEKFDVAEISKRYAHMVCDNDLYITVRTKQLARESKGHAD